MDSEIGHFIVAQNNAKQKTGGAIEVIRAVQSMQTHIYQIYDCIVSET